MADFVWPQSLPTSFLIEGFSSSIPDTSIRTNVSAGVPKVRQRYTATVTPVVGKMFMTTEQLNTLEEFYEETLRGGSLAFDFSGHPRKDGTYEYRFTKPPVPTPVGIDWKVELSLELLP